MKIKIALLSFSIVCMTACTHTPSVGEKMVTHSEETKRLGEQWTKAEESILDSKKLDEKGNTLIKEGDKQITQGRALIDKGEKKISKGSKMIDLSHTQLREGQRSQHESKSQFIEKYPDGLK